MMKKSIVVGVVGLILLAATGAIVFDSMAYKLVTNNSAIESKEAA